MSTPGSNLGKIPFLNRGTTHQASSFYQPKPLFTPSPNTHSEAEMLSSRSSSASGLDEVVVVEVLSAADAVVVAVVSLLELVQLHEVHRVPQQTADARETLAELRPLRALVRHELQRAAELLVVARGVLDEVLGLHLELAALVVLEDALLLRLLLAHVVHLLALQVAAAHHVPLVRELLPQDQRLHRSHLKRAHRVVHAEAVHVRVLCDLVKELVDQLLLLQELHVAQHVLAELDRLVESVLAAVRHVHKLHHRRLQTLVEQVGLLKVVLELGATGKDQTRHVRAVVRDEVRRRQLRDLTDVVATLLHTQTTETRSRLTTPSVLLRQLNSETVQDLTGVARQRAVQRAVTVHHDETVLVVGLKHLVHLVNVELVVAHVLRLAHRLERLDVDRQLLLLVVLRHHVTAEQDQSVRRRTVVQLQLRQARRDRRLHCQLRRVRLDRRGRAVLVVQQLRRLRDLVLGRDHQRDQTGGRHALGLLQTLDHLLQPPLLDVLVDILAVGRGLGHCG
eukprot:Rhum_TRINITY_DN14840_c11_g1::Rhum_TRINITY_DN14840_c11_g1_i3::g.125328::m.125328